jgi:nitroimidazol reductase NimA-like FMN-containing flavoprotein (pyridoxamine 5'-phosphate oxidase superfamily)
MVIPMLYGRKKDTLYLHGHVSSGVCKKLQEGIPLSVTTTYCTGIWVCVTVSFLDGLVYAHSLFHSSVNYRSAVCFGKAYSITNKVDILHS